MKLRLNFRGSNLLWGLFAIALIVVFVVLMIKNPAPDHIEDTNGADNYSLQTITEQQIIEQSMGSRGGVDKVERKLTIGGIGISSGKEYSSKKFTGVMSLYITNLRKGSDIAVSLAEYEIKEGNFAFYVIFDGQIVGKITPGDDATADFVLEDVEKSATLEYVIAGESANFKFTPILGME